MLLAQGLSLLFQVKRSSCDCCSSATPHLGSPVVGRLLHRQVFPVIDACLAYCGTSCGRAGGEGGCLLSGMGCLGRGGSDVLHAAPQGNACSRKARRHLSCLSRNRRVQLRVCTTQGWVTFDRSIEKVDECDALYEHPVLYEIVGRPRHRIGESFYAY